jgi:hypothetical protein
LNLAGERVKLGTPAAALPDVDKRFFSRNATSPNENCAAPPWTTVLIMMEWKLPQIIDGAEAMQINGAGAMSSRLRALACILGALILPVQGRAEDDTNAASVTDLVWGQIHQVMGGTSAAVPGSSTILGPTGVYVVVIMSTAIANANAAYKADSTQTVDQYLTNYYSLLLSNTAVSGLLLLADWSDLNPSDGTYAWNGGGCGLPGQNCYLDDAFMAVGNSLTPKTLQLGVSPGFHSPPWLFGEIDVAVGGLGAASGAGSCDGLFTIPPATSVSSLCGYTSLFWDTEDNANNPTQLPLPLPWNLIPFP